LFFKDETKIEARYELRQKHETQNRSKKVSRLHFFITQENWKQPKKVQENTLKKH
jgi:hypothetical protein